MHVCACTCMHTAERRKRKMKSHMCTCKCMHSKNEKSQQKEDKEEGTKNSNVKKYICMVWGERSKQTSKQKGKKLKSCAPMVPAAGPESSVQESRQYARQHQDKAPPSRQGLRKRILTTTPVSTLVWSATQLAAGLRTSSIKYHFRRPLGARSQPGPTRCA